MKILLLGSGAREHSLAWKIAQSPRCSDLFIAPGNGGTSQFGTNIEIQVGDFDNIGKCIKDKAIGMLVVGPEVPLVKGIVDFLKESGITIPVIGPSKNGAMLEGSKDFSKGFMKRHYVPTASYKTFSANDLQAGMAYIDKHSLPIVLKADGLAAGKGVLICQEKELAKKELAAMLCDEKFGKAGSKVVIEEFLEGIEFSVFVATDGKSYKILPNAKDYKRIGEGDTGLNTGGMGAISPVPFVNNDLMMAVDRSIIQPTILGLAKEGIDYKGFIYFGLIQTKKGVFVIEYNCRLGDPEAEVILPRLNTDIVELFEHIASGRIDDLRIQEDPRSCATVVLVAGGYPGLYQKGKQITGMDKARNCILFHGGTAVSGDNLLSNGGRVIAVSALGESLKAALDACYKGIDQIKFEQMNYRKDIGYEFLS